MQTKITSSILTENTSLFNFVQWRIDTSSLSLQASSACALIIVSLRCTIRARVIHIFFSLTRPLFYVLAKTTRWYRSGFAVLHFSLRDSAKHVPPYRCTCTPMHAKRARAQGELLVVCVIIVCGYGGFRDRIYGRIDGSEKQYI